MEENTFEEKIKNLGKAIRIVREMQGLTQFDLARLAEIDRSNLQKVERGKNTSIQLLLRICAALNIEDYVLCCIAWDESRGLLKQLETQWVLNRGAFVHRGPKGGEAGTGERSGAAELIRSMRMRVDRGGTACIILIQILIRIVLKLNKDYVRKNYFLNYLC